MVEITNASNLMPASITVVEDGTTIEVTSTPLEVSVNSGVVTIQTGGIISVNGDTGPAVTLDTGDINEGSNLYYTDARADARVDLQTGANLDLSQKSTTDLTEGTNLYYTDGRVDANFATKTTTDLTEGTNLYYTDARARGAISATGDINYDNTSGVISYTTPSIPSDVSDLTDTGGLLERDDLSNNTTSDLAEGVNLYYTSARANTDFDTRLATKDTGDLTEGSNLYYTSARANTDFDTRLATKDTGDLTEGSNLYYTDSRVQSVIDTNTAGFITASSSDTLTNKSGLISQWTNDAGYLTSETDSQTLSFANPNLTISNGNTVDLSALTPTSLDWTAITNTPTTISGYGITDAYTTTNFNTDFATKTTTDLTEGTNLYYTDARAQAVSINALSEDTVPQLSADLDANNNYITNLLDPVNNQDAATKLYVDNSIAGASVTTSTATILEVRNTTGSAIAKGVPVYLSGHSGNKILVAPADADDPTKMPAIGLMNATLSNNSDGEVISFGLITGIDMSTFSIGDTLYIDTTPGGSTFGGLTNTPPTGETSAIQNIGKVARNVSNGEFIVSGPGRSNATPNLDTDQFFLGNASNQAEATDFTAAVEARSINNVVEDLSPQLGSSLDVNNFAILNNGSNEYFYLGDTGNLIPATHAKGAWRSKSITGFTGATRAWFNGDTSKLTLGSSVSASNGRIVNNYQSTTLDLNSYSLTSTGITRGLHTLFANSPTIQNTGGTAASLAQNRNVMVQGMFLEGSNITVDESSSVYINQFYEGDDGTGTITNAYGLYINDAGASGATVTNKYSIYSNGANNPMYHAGTVTIGAFTLPNTDGSAGQVLTTDGLGNVTWTTVSGGGAYGDADVDLHLNTSTAATGEVLSWNGVDYDWIAAGGGGSFTGDLAGATLEDTTNSSIAMNDVIHISTDATHNTKPASIRISENEYVDGPSILIQKANGFDIDGGYLQVQKRTNAVTGAYPRLVHILDAADVAPGSTTTPTQSFNQQFRRVYYNTYHNAWENWTQTVHEYGLNGSFNINGGNGYVGTSNQKMNWGVPMDFQQGVTSGFAFNDGATAVFSILTGANAITRTVAIEINTGGGQPTQFNAIDDQAWLNTGVGVYNSRIDPWWAYGTNWNLTMKFTMPSWAAQSTVTVDKAFPPVGQIVTQFGFVYPSYANTPAWANTGARQITMTRPASGRNLYEYTFECVNGALFVRDWRLDNVA